MSRYFPRNYTVILYIYQHELFTVQNTNMIKNNLCQSFNSSEQLYYLMPIFKTWLTMFQKLVINYLIRRNYVIRFIQLWLYFPFFQAKGKIIVYNQQYVSYGKTVQYRALGAREAAKVGGVASLIRSVTPFSIYSPHTGWQVHIEATQGCRKATEEYSLLINNFANVEYSCYRLQLVKPQEHLTCSALYDVYINNYIYVIESRLFKMPLW